MKAVSDMKLNKAIQKILAIFNTHYTKTEVDANHYTKDEVDANHYTRDEVDEKFSNISTGGSVGMCREFDSGKINTASVLIESNKSKVFTLMLYDGYYYYSTIIDYRFIDQSYWITDSDGERTNETLFIIPAHGGRFVLGVSIHKDDTSAKSVLFKVSTGDTPSHRIVHICGYY